MTLDDARAAIEEIELDEDQKQQFAILKHIEMIVAFLAIGTGVVIVLGGIGYNILRFVGLIPADIPAAMALTNLLFLGMLIFGMGYGAFKIWGALRNYEMWAYSGLLYLNLLIALLYLLTFTTLGLILSVFTLVPVLLLFMPYIRRYWYPTFREDLTPRLKEIRYSLYLIRKSPLVVTGIVIMVVFILLAIFAPFLAPYGPEQRIWDDVNLPPGSPSNVPGNPVHFWGTDNSGGDTYSRILYGAQIDLRVSITVVLVAVTVGTILGAVSGYYGGKIDELMMRITDVFFAFPGLILAMAIVMALGSRSLDNISLSLMVTWWPAYARLVRGQVLAEREKLYVEAARSVGASDGRILLNHIIPNTIQPLIVQATMDTGAVLLVAAGLSFIGFGPPAGVAEWGLMIAKGQDVFGINPWAMFFPGMAILFVSLALNLVGDGIRDIMDPKLRRR
ncbi:MAG: ABC transporter permease [Candidatus Thorarchaeota archaeon]|nr:ABC transporter permease [Candidatus Thorarchaeota archaeon]